MEKNRNTYQRFLLVVDDFYDNPDHVADYAKGLDYYKPQYVTGYRTDEIYHEKKIRSKLAKMLGVKIVNWGTDNKSENGVFYLSFSEGSSKEIPGVHSDEPSNGLTAIIYLTPDIPATCGTSLYEHIETKLSAFPQRSDARRLGMPINKLRDLLENDSRKKNKWIETDRAGYKYNRLVAFPSGVFHSATNHWGSSPDDGRIFQAFRLNVDWNTFKR